GAAELLTDAGVFEWARDLVDDLGPDLAEDPRPFDALLGALREAVFAEAYWKLLRTAALKRYLELAPRERIADLLAEVRAKGLDADGDFDLWCRHAEQRLKGRL